MILKSLLHQNADHMLKKFWIKKNLGIFATSKKGWFVFFQNKNVFPGAISEECINEKKFPLDLWCHLKVRREIAVPIQILVSMTQAVTGNDVIPPLPQCIFIQHSHILTGLQSLINSFCIPHKNVRVTCVMRTQWQFLAHCFCFYKRNVIPHPSKCPPRYWRVISYTSYNIHIIPAYLLWCLYFNELKLFTVYF